MRKPAWTKPRLIVLVRSAAEEAVLIYCKLFSPEGAEAENGGCWTVGACIECTAPNPS
jgi:hypothetical protein